MSRFKTFISNFFKNDTSESMMRLISFLLVVSGIFIVAMAVGLDLNGGHYGLELAILGVIGKGYQKRIEN